MHRHRCIACEVSWECKPRGTKQATADCAYERVGICDECYVSKSEELDDNLSSLPRLPTTAGAKLAPTYDDDLATQLLPAFRGLTLRDFL